MIKKNITRRAFLRSAAAIAAAPAIVPSSVFGRYAPSNRVNLAAIGVGNRGALYASPKSLQTAQIREDEKPVIRSSSQGRDFVECMRSRRPTINPLESAIRSDTISHLSDIAIRLGRPVRWDPEKERIIGDGEAAKRLDRPMRRPWVI